MCCRCPAPLAHCHCRLGIDAVPTFFIRCGGSKEVQLVGAESVKAFEVAFRKVGGFQSAARFKRFRMLLAVRMSVMAFEVAFRKVGEALSAWPAAPVRLGTAGTLLSRASCLLAAQGVCNRGALVPGQPCSIASVCHIMRTPSSCAGAARGQRHPRLPAHLPKGGSSSW